MVGVSVTVGLGVEVGVTVKVGLGVRVGGSAAEASPGRFRREVRLHPTLNGSIAAIKSPTIYLDLTSFSISASSCFF
jgi:hypothetical protein